jgi:hypothetical protein
MVGEKVSEGRVELPPGVTRTRPSTRWDPSAIVQDCSSSRSTRVRPGRRTPTNDPEPSWNGTIVTKCVTSSRVKALSL